MILKDRSSPIKSVGDGTDTSQQRQGPLVLAGAVAFVAFATLGLASPAFAVNGETTANLYSADAPTGYEFTVPCDMTLNVADPTADDAPAAKVSCHLWDEFAVNKSTADRDMGLAADVQIEGANLVLPGEVDEPDETIRATTFAQMTCGQKSDGTEFCIVPASTAGTAKIKGKKIDVTRGGIARLLVENDSCTSGCATGGGPFDVVSDGVAIAQENAAIRLVYAQAGWVEWKFAMNNTDIGKPGAYRVTLDTGLSGSVHTATPAILGAIVAPAEIFTAIRTPGLYCTINGVCIRY